jgi:4-hydroxy-tetrahydrodipicolinate synthase
MLSGEDHTALAFRVQGGHGCISVTANVAPRACADMHESWEKGEVQHAMQINQRLLPLNDALFAETSPGPVKFAVSLLGKSTAEVRLPLVAPMPETQDKVRHAMRHAGVLN